MKVAEKQTEAQFMEAVVKYARLAGWLVYHTHDSRHSAAGFPDLVMCRPPRLIFAELKSERGRLSQPQREWYEALNRVEWLIAPYLWRPRDWPLIEETLR